MRISAWVTAPTRTPRPARSAPAPPGSASVSSTRRNGYLHPQTEFSATLQQPHRQAHTIEGQVVWCRFLMGRMHALGVVSEEPIEVRDLVDPDEWVETCASDAERLLPISGAVLTYCENDLSKSAVHLHLATQDIDDVYVDSQGALTGEFQRLARLIERLRPDPAPTNTTSA